MGQLSLLIICVIPANATRLTSNQALGMVIDANKCSNCIIALSMIDILHEDDYEELLINRLLNNNDEIILYLHIKSTKTKHNFKFSNKQFRYKIKLVIKILNYLHDS